MTQPDLFALPAEEVRGVAYARRTDPPTSHEAARGLKAEGEATRLEGVVLKAIRQAYPDGLTNHEIVAKTGLDWNTASPRVKPLVEKGLVEDSGEKRTGPKGRGCIVWKAVRNECGV